MEFAREHVCVCAAMLIKTTHSISSSRVGVCGGWRGLDLQTSDRIFEVSDFSSNLLLRGRRPAFDLLI